MKDLPYPVDAALEMLAPFRHVVTVGAKPPVAFFAYPDKPSALHASGAELHALASDAEDGPGALAALAAALGAEEREPERQPPELPSMPADGPLDKASIAALLARHLPEQAIVVRRGPDASAATSSPPPAAPRRTTGSRSAAGRSAAASRSPPAPPSPARSGKVICPRGGRQRHVHRAGALDPGAGAPRRDHAGVRQPPLRDPRARARQRAGARQRRDRAAHALGSTTRRSDWVAMARGMGVEAVRVSSVAELDEALGRGLSSQGPFLVEVCVVAGFPPAVRRQGFPERRSP